MQIRFFIMTSLNYNPTRNTIEIASHVKLHMLLCSGTRTLAGREFEDPVLISEHHSQNTYTTRWSYISASSFNLSHVMLALQYSHVTHAITVHSTPTL